MIKMGLSIQDYDYFLSIAQPIMEKEIYQQLKNYIQHQKITTYEHCFSVALSSYRMAKKLPIKYNYEVLIRSALLHDFCLYDWHDKNKGFHLHGFKHARFACQNAISYYNISVREQKNIKSHMWPLTLFSIPSSREAWLLCIVDKFVSIKEIFHCKSKNKPPL